MARMRRTRRPTLRDAKSAARLNGRDDGRVKVTMLLPRSLRNRLLHESIESDQDIGRIAEPGIRRELEGAGYTRRRLPELPPVEPDPDSESERDPAGEEGPDLRVTG